METMQAQLGRDFDRAELRRISGSGTRPRIGSQGSGSGSTAAASRRWP